MHRDLSTTLVTCHKAGPSRSPVCRMAGRIDPRRQMSITPGGGSQRTPGNPVGMGTRVSAFPGLRSTTSGSSRNLGTGQTRHPGLEDIGARWTECLIPEKTCLHTVTAESSQGCSGGAQGTVESQYRNQTQPREQRELREGDTLGQT